MQKKNYDSYAETLYLRISASKLRKVASEIRGRNVEYSLQFLKNFSQKSASLIYKSLFSAYSNAANKGLNVKDLQIADIIINDGSVLKRFKARARGRGYQIQKKTSHIKIGLIIKNGEKNGSKG